MMFLLCLFQGATEFLDLIAKLDRGHPAESELPSNPDLVKTDQGFIYCKSGMADLCR